ncbi:MAG: Appr-1-p processing protein [Deltaproteobacteria bacterium]|nr:MAG: Appr-1-p processing protein [Deltaproteobacteria bacterium]
MIREVEGDILLTRAHAIAHGVAPNDLFTHGLSLTLRQRWPAMYNDFLRWNKDNQAQPGDVLTWQGVGGVRVVHLFTQESTEEGSVFPGRACLYHVKRCINRLKEEIVDQGIISLALPRLATGAGGLKWDEVSHVIYPDLEEVHIPIVVYATYTPGIAANERITTYTA